MATTEQIEQAAKDLGKQVGEHQAARELHAAEKALADDVEAQRLVNDFNRLLQKLAEKQAQQQPIEVEEKRQLESLQTQIASHLLIHRLQKAQMDYMDLMRNVVSTISEQAGGDPEAPTAPPVAGRIQPG